MMNFPIRLCVCVPSNKGARPKQSKEIQVILVMLPLEFAILDWIQENLRNPVFDVWMPALTALGNGGFIWIVLSGVLLCIPKFRKTGAAVLAALALEAVCCNLLLKPWAARIRPCDWNTAVQLLIARPEDFSFPSGHTGAAFAVVAALWIRKNWLWRPCFILAVLIAFSRLYLYVHFPTDVLAGILLGVGAGWLGSRGTLFAERRLPQK